MCLPLKVIVQRLQLCRTSLPRECHPDQVVGQMRVFGQQAPVKVGANGVCLNHSLGAVLAVVSVSADHPTKHPCAGTNVRPATMVLETDHGTWATSRRTNPVDHHVSNAPLHG